MFRELGAAVNAWEPRRPSARRFCLEPVMIELLRCPTHLLRIESAVMTVFATGAVPDAPHAIG
jgi:hypothetical protein